MPIKEKNLTVHDIRNKIIDHRLCARYTYIILGKPGPTGKSWLTEVLKKEGLNAIEISEYVAGHITYDDCTNHLIEDTDKNIITIILNRPLEE